MRLTINVLPGELEAAARVCRDEVLGAEITALADPVTLDGRELSSEISRHDVVLEGIAPRSSHGPFFDLHVASRDPEIVRVCRERHETALRATIQLSASVYVAHLNSLPQIRNRAYREDFAARAASFWSPLADLAADHGVTIALENMWETTPELQRSVVEAADHPGLGASFDNGHALVFSRVPAVEWIDVLGPRLVHCHLHDNDGTADQHLPVGRGREEWGHLLPAIGSLDPAPLVVLESDTLERNLESLASIRKRIDRPRT